MTSILFELLTFGAVFSSVLVITSKNPVIAVVFLISLFISTAGYLILLGIGFVGLSYIIIYIGAITVLFLFIIMMINIRLVDILEIGSEYTKNLPLAIILGLLFVYEIYSILPFTFNNINILYLPYTVIYNFNLLLLLLEDSLSLAARLFSGNFGTTDNPSLWGLGSGEGLGESSNFINYSFNYIDSFVFNFSQIEILGLGLYTNGSAWLFLCSFILLLAMISAIFLSSNSKR